MDTFLLALRVVVSLGVVVGAIWFVQRRSTKAGRSRKTTKKPISVIARQNLGQKASVAVVEFGGKQFLLGVTEHGISVLHGGADEAEAAPAQEFGAILSAVAPADLALESADPSDGAETLDAAAPVTGPTPVTGATPVSGATPIHLSTRRAHRALTAKQTKLAGSVLSGTTWKQAYVAIRGGQ